MAQAMCAALPTAVKICRKSIHTKARDFLANFILSCIVLPLAAHVTHFKRLQNCEPIMSIRNKFATAGRSETAARRFVVWPYRSYFTNAKIEKRKKVSLCLLHMPKCWVDIFNNTAKKEWEMKVTRLMQFLSRHWQVTPSSAEPSPHRLAVLRRLKKKFSDEPWKYLTKTRHVHCLPLNFAQHVDCTLLAVKSDALQNRRRSEDYVCARRRENLSKSGRRMELCGDCNRFAAVNEVDLPWQN